MYDALPDKITIYRGCDRRVRQGRRRLSWTIYEGCAHWFANRVDWTVGGEPVVYKGVIKKKDVALVFSGIEQEIVPFNAKAISNIETLAFDQELANECTRKRGGGQLSEAA